MAMHYTVCGKTGFDFDECVQVPLHLLNQRRGEKKNEINFEHFSFFVSA